MPLSFSRRILTSSLIAAGGLALGPARPQGAGRYAVTPLGVLPGSTHSLPWAVSDTGVVVGAARGEEMGQVAFLWQAGKMRPLPGLPPAECVAALINGKGEIAGQVSVGAADDRVFLLSGGKLTRLPKPPGSEREWPTGLNVRGAVCGFGHDAEGRPRACWWPRGGAAVDLHALLRKSDSKIVESRALGINDQGLIVGEAELEDEHSRAFIMTAGKAALLSLSGAPSSGATAINNAGQVAGWFQGSGGRRLALYQNGKVQDLGVLPGCTDMQPTAMSARGEIVGFAEAAEKPQRAFVWKPGPGGGKLLDLTAHLAPGSGWSITIPRSINAKGQIAAAGELKGKDGGLLLTPR